MRKLLYLLAFLLITSLEARTVVVRDLFVWQRNAESVFKVDVDDLSPNPEPFWHHYPNWYFINLLLDDGETEEWFSGMIPNHEGSYTADYFVKRYTIGKIFEVVPVPSYGGGPGLTDPSMSNAILHSLQKCQYHPYLSSFRFTGDEEYLKTRWTFVYSHHCDSLEEFLAIYN